ncbi:MAG: aminotransferase class V-fold PLP-dependent enzyme [Pseudomonadota bacterium]
MPQPGAPIYLDYAATTPVDPRVAEQMSRALMAHGTFGNPASRSHAYGWQAEELVENARAEVAAALHADPREIVWTSGATESDNLALKGVVEGALGSGRNHIITSAIEHKAILDTCEHLQGQGCTVTYLAPDAYGRVSPQQVAEALTPASLIVSIMHVNNELGTVNDVAAIGQVCRDAGVWFHTDAAQGFGKVPLDMSRMPIDLVSISGHKIYGPKGIGVLYVRREPAVKVAAQIHGGGHEMGMRSGTLATHQIVGFGAAAALIHELHADEQAKLSRLRSRFLAHIQQIPDAVVHTHPEHHIPGIINVGFAGVDGETLLLALDDVACSNGSACTSASVEPSFVLKAIGVPDDLAHASLRFSLGRYTTEDEVERAGVRISEVVHRLRGP